MSIKSADVPTVCGECKTLHYVYQLACKNCGHYLDAQLQMAGTARNKAGLMAVAAVLLVAMAGACMFHFI